MVLSFPPRVTGVSNVEIGSHRGTKHREMTVSRQGRGRGGGKNSFWTQQRVDEIFHLMFDDRVTNGDIAKHNAFILREVKATIAIGKEVGMDFDLSNNEMVNVFVAIEEEE